MNAQLLFDALSPRLLRCWLLLASLLIGSGCDWLALPVCRLSPMTTGCPDGGVTPDLSAVNPDSPLGPLRKFEWRAKITNDANQKFVGILQREYAIMLSNKTQVSFSAVRFQLDQASEPMRLSQIACPAGPGLVPRCPLPTNINFAYDSVYLTNETAPTFWLLRNHILLDDESYTIQENGDLTMVDQSGNLKGKRRPFFHPILDASLIPTISSSGYSSDILRLTVGSTTYSGKQTQSGTVTAAMIGDIDATDPVKNGVEVVRFGSTAVASVYHHDPAKPTEVLDAELQKTLNDEISKRIVDTDKGIGAAYVNDLNTDGFLDFVFSLGGNIFASSYKGKPRNGSLPVFEAWPERVLHILPDEKIQSIMAMDITKDGYPELIVVTDKFVHFYLNTP